MTLATAYWCVLIAAVLPYVWIALAKTGAAGYNNRNPRAWVARQEGNYRVQRANAAHLNAFEAFAPFAAGVVMAQLAGVGAPPPPRGTAARSGRPAAKTDLSAPSA